MDRKGHYLKPATKCTAPGVVLSLVVQTESAAAAVGRGITVSRFHRAYGCVSTFRRGRWSYRESEELGTPEAARAWVRSAAVAGRVNWVVCPIASYVLTHIKWWEHAEALGCDFQPRSRYRVTEQTAVDRSGRVTLSSLVIRGSPDVIGYHEGGKFYRWVSGHQYFPDGPGTTGEREYVHQRVRGVCGPDRHVGVGTGYDSLRSWHFAFRALCDWWRDTARAPFAATVGGLAWGLLRSWCPVRTLCTHGDSDAHSLERGAAFGGRASTWYVGDVGHGTQGEGVLREGSEVRVTQKEDGPITLVDVRSMYPWIMREYQFPCKLQSYRENVEPRVAVEHATAFGVIARVTIRTQVDEYPYRSGVRVVYPIGQFVTTLTGPELLELSKHGEIVKCHAIAIYRLGRPFVEYANRLLSLRQMYKDAGDVTRESFSKLMANSLAGKLAQRKGTWERAEYEDTPGLWGDSFRLNLDTQKVTRHRHIAGVAFRYSDDPSGSGPHTAAFAYVAAYGRLLMRSLRGGCPPRSVVSQDTDGLWVLPPALRATTALTGRVGPSPGQLRIEDSGSNARFFGPRHYCVDGRWTLSGFRSPIVRDNGLHVEHSIDTPIWAMRSPVAPCETVTVRRTSTLALDVHGVDVGEDGWTSPRRNR